MYNLYPTDVLAHHGVKGQKWGVRRTKEQLGNYTGSRIKKEPNLIELL